jgi:hypothetical protein
MGAKPAGHRSALATRKAFQDDRRAGTQDLPERESVGGRIDQDVLLNEKPTRWVGYPDGKSVGFFNSPAWWGTVVKAIEGVKFESGVEVKYKKQQTETQAA